jgi:PH (Pleckstrin Homology) domain-containing protein
MPNENSAKAAPPAGPPPLAPAQALQPGEQVLATFRRHPIGLVYIYLETIAAAAAIAALIIVLAPDFFGELTNQENIMLTFILVLLVGLVVFVLLLLTSVYRANRLTITNKAVIQTLQRGPFSQKMSRLSMADVEDVTSDQKGLLQTIFNYGILNVETSGELKNFVFPFCPNPSLYATTVSEARQKYAETFGGG